MREPIRLRLNAARLIRRVTIVQFEALKRFALTTQLWILVDNGSGSIGQERSNNCTILLWPDFGPLRSERALFGAYATRGGPKAAPDVPAHVALVAETRV